MKARLFFKGCIVITVITILIGCKKEDPDMLEPDTKEPQEITVKLPFSSESETFQAEINSGAYVIEGDIAVARTQPGGNSPQNAAIINGDNVRWPNGIIPFSIEAQHPATNDILEAIDEVNELTNLCLIERTNEDDFVEFIETNGCWSWVGRQGDRQEIGISQFCGIGSIIHEICHAAGLFHEQSRDDRDNFVQINWANIQDGREHNFRSYVQSNIAGDDLGTYNYGSIMHYPENAFSINGQPTIEPLTPNVQIGQRDGLSQGDIEAINSIYPTDGCNTTPVFGLLSSDLGQLTVSNTIAEVSRVGEWAIDPALNDVEGKGDFDGDGLDDFIMFSPWGIGIFSVKNDNWEVLAMKPNGTRFGGWLFDANANKIRGIGDFNRDGKDDFIITSGWGIGILTLNGNSLTTIILKPNGTRFGEWLFDSNHNPIHGIGDFNNDGKDDFIITSGWGMGILTLSGNTLTTVMLKPNGTRFGEWLLDSNANNIRGIGDLNNDGRDDFIITSGWGMGLLTLAGNSLTTIMLKPNGTRFGEWLYDSNQNTIHGVGDFNNDGKDDFIITSGWGMGILTLSGSSLTTSMLAPNGTRFGGWLYNSNQNTIHGIEDFNDDGKDDFVISSGWGIGILSLNSSTLTDIGHNPFGANVNQWPLENNDLITVTGHFHNSQKAAIVIQKK